MWMGAKYWYLFKPRTSAMEELEHLATLNLADLLWQPLNLMLALNKLPRSNFNTSFYWNLSTMTFVYFLTSVWCCALQTLVKIYNTWKICFKLIKKRVLTSIVLVLIIFFCLSIVCFFLLIEIYQIFTLPFYPQVYNFILFTPIILLAGCFPQITCRQH